MTKRRSDVMVSLQDPEPPRFLTQDACASIVHQLLGDAQDTRWSSVNIGSRWRGSVRWGRNRIAVASDWRNVSIGIDYVAHDKPDVEAYTNQIDQRSLARLVSWVDRLSQTFGTRHTNLKQHTTVVQPYPLTHIWSDATFAQSPEQRSTIAGELIAGAEQAGMLSAGYISVEARGISYRTEEGLFLYAPQTIAQCSVTVRDPLGTGSGWAGRSSYDWNRFDAHHIAAVALDKCLKSRNPVKVEPGRYTLILEPQATYELVNKFSNPVWGGYQYLPLERTDNEILSFGAFHQPSGRVAPQTGGQMIAYPQTKIGQQIVDRRITLSFDPAHPDLGVIPFTEKGEAFVPVTWIDRGVLTTLAYDRDYGQEKLHEPWGIPNSDSYYMSGGSSTIEEMIRTTKRGLLVTRFWGIDTLDAKSMLLTGMTRDGFWLIENGTITKAVKNMRWTESVLFALNNVEEMGPPVPVFSPEAPAVVPSIKVRDFNFTALADAV